MFDGDPKWLPWLITRVEGVFFVQVEGFFRLLLCVPLLPFWLNVALTFSVASGGIVRETLT